MRSSPSRDKREPERGGQEEPGEPVVNNRGEHRKQHDSIVVPIGQGLLNFRVAKAEEAQGSPIVRDRMKDRVNFSHVDGQLPPAMVRALQEPIQYSGRARTSPGSKEKYMPPRGQLLEGAS